MSTLNGLFFHQFQVESSSLFYLFNPFQSTTWLVTIGVFVLSTLCYCLLDLRAINFKQEEKRSRCKPDETAIWYIVQIWLSQSKCRTCCTLFYLLRFNEHPASYNNMITFIGLGKISNSSKL